MTARVARLKGTQVSIIFFVLSSTLLPEPSEAFSDISREPERKCRICRQVYPESQYQGLSPRYVIQQVLTQPELPVYNSPPTSQDPRQTYTIYSDESSSSYSPQQQVYQLPPAPYSSVPSPQSYNPPEKSQTYSSMLPPQSYNPPETSQTYSSMLPPQSYNPPGTSQTYSSILPPQPYDQPQQPISYVSVPSPLQPPVSQPQIPISYTSASASSTSTQVQPQPLTSYSSVQPPSIQAQEQPSKSYPPVPPQTIQVQPQPSISYPSVPPQPIQVQPQPSEPYPSVPPPPIQVQPQPSTSFPSIQPLPIQSQSSAYSSIPPPSPPSPIPQPQPATSNSYVQSQSSYEQSQPADSQSPQQDQSYTTTSTSSVLNPSFPQAEQSCLGALESFSSHSEDMESSSPYYSHISYPHGFPKSPLSYIRENMRGSSHSPRSIGRTRSYSSYPCRHYLQSVRPQIHRSTRPHTCNQHIIGYNDVEPGHQYSSRGDRIKKESSNIRFASDLVQNFNGYHMAADNGDALPNPSKFTRRSSDYYGVPTYNTKYQDDGSFEDEGLQTASTMYGNYKPYVRQITEEDELDEIEPQPERLYVVYRSDDPRDANVQPQSRNYRMLEGKSRVDRGLESMIHDVDIVQPQDRMQQDNLYPNNYHRYYYNHNVGKHITPELQPAFKSLNEYNTQDNAYRYDMDRRYVSSTDNENAGNSELQKSVPVPVSVESSDVQIYNEAGKNDEISEAKKEEVKDDTVNDAIVEEQKAVETKETGGNVEIKNKEVVDLIENEETPSVDVKEPSDLEKLVPIASDEN